MSNPGVTPANEPTVSVCTFPALRTYLRWRYLLAGVFAAVACGVIGAVFTWMLSGVEHAAYGFTTGSFAEAITRVEVQRRFIVVCAAGMFVAVAWYLLRRFGPSIPSVAQLYQGKKIPFIWMAADTTLQVLNVAFGGSIGREGAPRQASALATAQAGARLGLDTAQCRLLTACAAGAGLAAIYNVPLGGTVFTLEIMIGCRVLWASRKSFLPVVISALAVSWLATLVARMAVPDRPAYLVHWTTTEPLLLVVALVVGPLAGVAGYGFGRIVERTSKSAPQGRSILWTMPLCYLLLAALAIPFPLILGNGHALAENLVRREVPLAMVAMLVFAKPIATLLTVRAGATGGKLTPSLSTGAALGAIMAAGCALLFPVHAGMVALLGAGAFLAGSLRAPLTAGVLIIELSGARPDMWPMVALAVAGSWAVSAALKHKKDRQDSQRDPHCLE